MSSPQQQFSQTTTSAYQYIIISLIAAVVIGTGVLTLMYKKKRRRDFLMAVQAGRQLENDFPRDFTLRGDEGWVELTDGTFVPISRRNGELWGRDGEIGKQPEIWDVVLDGEEEVLLPDEKRTDYSASASKLWNPLAVTVPDHANPSTPSNLTSVASPRGAPLVELSVLITLPSPSTSPSNQKLASSGSSSSRPSSDLPPKYNLPFEDLEDLPHVMIASTTVSVDVPEKRRRDWEKLQSSVARPAQATIGQTRNLGRRVVRTDGFSTG